MAAAIGVPHYILNFERQFQQTVVANFVGEYVAGRTPIPCAHCNSDLKFSTLLERAQGFGAEVVATGHYARVEQAADGRWLLRRGVDPDKDQAYFVLAHPGPGARGVSSRRAHEVQCPRARTGAGAARGEAGQPGFASSPTAITLFRRARRRRRQAAAADEWPALPRGRRARFTVGQRKGFGVASQIRDVLRIDADSSGDGGIAQAALERRAPSPRRRTDGGALPAGWRCHGARSGHLHRPAAGRVRALPRIAAPRLIEADEL